MLSVTLKLNIVIIKSDSTLFQTFHCCKLRSFLHGVLELLKMVYKQIRDVATLASHITSHVTTRPKECNYLLSAMPTKFSTDNNILLSNFCNFSALSSEQFLKFETSPVPKILSICNHVQRPAWLVGSQINEPKLSIVYTGTTVLNYIHGQLPIFV